MSQTTLPDANGNLPISVLETLTPEREQAMADRDARLAESIHPPRSWDRYYEACAIHRVYRTQTPMPNMACQEAADQ